MSKWAEKKKRKIIIIVGIVLLLLFGLLVRSFTNKKPTCFDGIQNGGESGVDCGGACAQYCRAEINDIVVWWQRAFRVTDGLYNVVAYVENQNLEAGLQELRYEFRMYDENQILAAEPRIGSTFIEPNKRSAIFEPGIITGENEVYDVFFKISSVQDWKRTNELFAYNIFSVSNPQVADQDFIPKLSAEVLNESPYNFKQVPVVAILLNNKGNAIASSQTYIDAISQGDTQTVYFSWPEPFTEPIAEIEIIPRVDPFTPISSID